MHVVTFNVPSEERAENIWSALLLGFWKRERASGGALSVDM